MLTEAVRKAERMTEPDASGDSEEYRTEDTLAEVGSVREHRALRPVEDDSVEAGCCKQAAASREDKPLAAAWLQGMLASRRMSGVRQVRAIGSLRDWYCQQH